MPRRLFTPELRSGLIELGQSEAHHARNVLRVSEGNVLELFDAAGNIGTATVRQVQRQRIVVEVRDVIPPRITARIAVFSALPKGERADWMIEKLSELGVDFFVPLIADRSVVEARPNKIERWKRIAIESAKQSKRRGVMEIGLPTSLEDAVAGDSNAVSIMFTTQGDAQPITCFQSQLAGASARLFVGPEGGWTDQEQARMTTAGLTAARLTETILRVETAAVAAAAIVASIVCATSGNERRP